MQPTGAPVHSTRMTLKMLKAKSNCENCSVSCVLLHNFCKNSALALFCNVELLERRAASPAPHRAPSVETDGHQCSQEQKKRTKKKKHKVYGLFRNNGVSLINELELIYTLQSVLHAARCECEARLRSGQPIRTCKMLVQRSRKIFQN